MEERSLVEDSISTEVLVRVILKLLWQEHISGNNEESKVMI